MIEKSNTLIKGSIALEISESKTIADELKELEINQTIANKWDGKLPTVSGGEEMILDMSSITKDK